MIIARRAATCGLLAVACWVAAIPGACADPPRNARPSDAAMAAVQAATQGEVVLLDFAASWCGPCRQMAPIIGEITAAGWVVRHVDVDREPNLVKRFGVTGVPCYILLVQGEEVGRINGATTRADLEHLLAKSRQPLGLPAVPVAAAPAGPTIAAIPGIPLPASTPTAPLATEPPAGRQAIPEAIVRGPSPPAKAGPRASAREAVAPTPAAATSPTRGADPQARVACEQKLLQATARLRVDDTQGMSRGTGTVIDSRQGEALILTCGHIFRDSGGKGRIEVDLFGPHGPRGVAGQLVAYDLKRDLALISIFTDQPIEPVRVGGADCDMKAGEPVVTVGCNGGDDPTFHYSRINGIDKYLGPANVQVAGQPVQGRSGGGLFSLDGTLIGVCNAADPADNEGLFAALPAIHEQLDEAGLAFVYRSVYPSGGVAGAAADHASMPSMPEEMPKVAFDRRDRADAVPTASTAADRTTPVTADPRAALQQPSPAQPPAQPSGQLSSGEEALLQHVRQHEGKAEVICIVRPHGAPQGSSEVFVLQNASREFLDELSRTHLGAATRPDETTATLPTATRSR